jgi:hypothetical protein
MAKSGRYLIPGLKIWFDLMLFVGGAAAVLVMVLGVGTTFEPSDQADWTVAVPIALGEGQLESVLSLESAPEGATDVRIVDGRGKLRFDTLDNLLYLGSIFYYVVAGLIALFVIFLLRRILVATRGGDPFSQANVRDLMAIGWIMVGAGAVGPFLERGFVSWVLAHFETTGVTLSPPPLGLGFETIVTGLLVLVLASVWREAVAMAQEQSLTV